nr:ABC transporter permease [Salsipaludibacter albus]
MVIGAGVVLGAGLIASVLGTVAGWYGGWVDALVSRSADVLFSIPIILTALVLFGITEERTVLQIVLVLTLFAWPPMLRLVRGAVREQRNEEHVLAARALGAKSGYIMRRHVIMHSIRPMVVFALPYMATIISLEAILSFLGVGLQLPNISWGLMLANLGSRLVSLRFAGAPHLIIPGIVLSLLVWSLVQIGARVRDSGRRPGRNPV